MRKLKVLDLFSGIGTFSYAFHRTGGFETVAFCEWDKECHKVLKKNFPGVPIFTDIATIKFEEGYLVQGDLRVYIGDVDVIVGGFPCFAAGTHITTRSGYKPIESVVVGEEVLTHTNSWKKVSKTFENPPKELFDLKVQGAPDTKVTSEHPYLARVKTKVWDNSIRRYVSVYSEPEWVAAKDLTDNHFVCVPRIQESKNAEKITLEEAWLLGRYTADGYIQDSKRPGRKNSYNKKVIFCVGEGKHEHFEKSVTSYHWTKAQQRTCAKYIINSERLLNLARFCGRGAENKCVPQYILEGSKEVATSYLEGYMSGDGSTQKNNFNFCTVSEKLAMGMSQVVLKSKDTHCNFYRHEVTPTTVIEGRKVNQKTRYSGRFEKEKIKKTCLVDSNGAWMKVKSIKSTGTLAPVYNLEVEEDHTYVANNIIVHNCTDASVAGKKKGLFHEGKITRSGHWVYYKEIIKHVKPRWVLIENVRNLLNLGFASVLKDLHEVGANAEWEVISARDVGACHLRERLWITAYPHSPALRNITKRDAPGWDEVQTEGEAESSDYGGERNSPAPNLHNFRFWPTFATEEDKQKWWAKATAEYRDWWKVMPDTRGVYDGPRRGLHEGDFNMQQNRVDVLRRLANSFRLCADFNTGQIFSLVQRGAKGEPVELRGFLVNGYITHTVYFEGRKHCFRAHQIILALSGKFVGEGKAIDHINRDKTDNRLCNLRIVTHSENSLNREFKGSAFSIEEKQKIYDLYQETDWSYQELACVFQVSKCSIRDYVKEVERLYERARQQRIKQLGNGIVEPIAHLHAKRILFHEAVDAL